MKPFCDYFLVIFESILTETLYSPIHLDLDVYSNIMFVYKQVTGKLNKSDVIMTIDELILINLMTNYKTK